MEAVQQGNGSSGGKRNVFQMLAVERPSRNRKFLIDQIPGIDSVADKYQLLQERVALGDHLSKSISILCNFEEASIECSIFGQNERSSNPQHGHMQNALVPEDCCPCGGAID